jgi:hypothetical protein
MNQDRRTPRPIRLPSAWFDETPRVTSADESRELLRADGGTIRAAISRSSASELAEFHETLTYSLSGPRAHAVIEYPAEVPAATAASLVGGWFGVTGRHVHEEVGGVVSHVVSGVGHRHDQAWHTDSTPWAVPNRYSILGLLSRGDGDLGPTGILPLTDLEQMLAHSGGTLTTLRTLVVHWRHNFPDLPDLESPILDAAQPRWVWPVLESAYESLTAELAQAVDTLAAALARAPHFEALVAPGRLLMFDNLRAMHRGPHLEQTSGRELVRIKVGGRVRA